MSTILQNRLGFAPWTDPRTRRLPGTIPVSEDDWLVVDDAYAAQMAERARLIETRPEAVHALSDAARPAADELLRWVLRLLPGRGHAVGATIRRPDGVEVTPDMDQPLLTLGRLCAEDFCLMLPGPAGEHILGGAILCFPAGWTLAEKFGRPMMGIHRPVAIYTEDVGRRVQRLLEGVRPGIGLLRGTAHHSNAPLHNPRTEAQGRATDAALPFIRVERQCLFRLPETGAVVFSIHTAVIREESLTPEQAAVLAEFPIRHAA
ncbi:heme-dependent oxidative N-demethylase family protein [Paracoccus sanguinis]|uniref:DUF3445 domain-containing protein n=1 Tax=Paracoccus sanguinis TaxID=1545044 RepID=A0A1H2SFQ7_9RHOB|nr:DUF3445 domain-containing protein [Paracoccus sanguinis]SDW29954.1 Protein of unknown function [Paracoccus sanguinis]